MVLNVCVFFFNCLKYKHNFYSNLKGQWGILVAIDLYLCIYFFPVFISLVTDNIVVIAEW